MKNLWICLGLLAGLMLSLQVNAQDIYYLNQSSPTQDSTFRKAVKTWEKSSYFPEKQEETAIRFEIGLRQTLSTMNAYLATISKEEVGTPIYVNQGQGVDRVFWVNKKGEGLDQTTTPTYVTNYISAPNFVTRDSFNPWGAQDPGQALMLGAFNGVANGLNFNTNYRTQKFHFTGNSPFATPSFLYPMGGF